MSDLFEDLRRQLEQLRDDLQSRLDRVERNVRHEAEPLDKDFAEQAVQRENEEVVDALGNEARRELARVHEALKRMNEGEYGICAACGEAIPEARLKILPQARLCAACASRQEGA
ncbi:TraR/DksA family transcriptional regulator [Thioalkalivibrio sulfidiphilus]|uniref:Transcriptional regulator, TraR/DksA family n=1 Tax=Thioalkalivibrio sulfidiphilus (strain HL-EbGR7) TaxID=396588 RepID=B8GPY8_THISH|nr:TraR/DksA family transcriptional regulator [Thioalkalivibrio sulfidiphilus]ACL74135.1 transcriptional regulator, TraR/DksA family [Thioalkalivibrio sulfidiphilus HL-EbGr7]